MYPNNFIFQMKNTTHGMSGMNIIATKTNMFKKKIAVITFLRMQI
jgi:hypothetical protein